MTPIMMKNGKFLILDDDYNLDYQRSVKMSIDHVLTDYMDRFPFYYGTIRELVKDIAKSVIETIAFYNEEKKVIETPLTKIHKIIMDEFSNLSDKQLNELSKTDYIRNMIRLYKDK